MAAPWGHTCERVYWKTKIFFSFKFLDFFGSAQVGEEMLCGGTRLSSKWSIGWTDIFLITVSFAVNLVAESATVPEWHLEIQK